MSEPIYKLGKRAPISDYRTLSLGKYLTKDLPPIPREYAYEPVIDGGYGMLLNDKLGCCTIASLAHLHMTWGAYTNKPAVFSDEDIIKAYSGVSGYDPVTGANDNGANLLNVMNYCRATGIGGHKIDAFTKVACDDLHLVKTGIFLFEGVNIGVMLPKNAQGKDVWEYKRDGGSKYGSWGGHCVPLVAYDGDWFTCITWGKLLKMDWRFFMEYADEIYCPYSKEMISDKGLAANGFNEKQLMKDLYEVEHD